MGSYLAPVLPGNGSFKDRVLALRDHDQQPGIHSTKLQARFLVNATSIAIGLNAMILTNSFGTLKDYFACLLWGLGAPIGSKAIASLVAVATGATAPT